MTEVNAWAQIIDRERKSRANFDVIQGVLAELGIRLSREDRILDIGCGLGSQVYIFRRNGLRAFGVDFEDGFAFFRKRMEDENLIRRDGEVLRRVETYPYRIPFDDGTFRFLYSQQVLEHVHDYKAFFAETSRILRPGGFALHVFPSRWQPLEGHTFVPFAGVFRPDSYLKFWAWFGVRVGFQRSWSWRRTAEYNALYLRNITSYPPRTTIELKARRHFATVLHVEGPFLKHRLRRGRFLAAFPPAIWLVRNTVMNAIVLRKNHGR